MEGGCIERLDFGVDQRGVHLNFSLVGLRIVATERILVAMN
jgi:hypothetical protein